MHSVIKHSDETINESDWEKHEKRSHQGGWEEIFRVRKENVFWRAKEKVREGRDMEKSRHIESRGFFVKATAWIRKEVNDI